MTKPKKPRSCFNGICYGQLDEGEAGEEYLDIYQTIFDLTEIKKIKTLHKWLGDCIRYIEYMNKRKAK